MATNEVFNEAGVMYVTSNEPVSTFKEFRYKWTHVPSGTVGYRSVYLWRHNTDHRARLLSYWNSVHPGIWSYEEAT
jgi:hypothetical protein